MKILTLCLGALCVAGAAVAFDARHFPGQPENYTINDQMVLLDASHWQLPDGYTVVSDGDGLLASSQVAVNGIASFAALDSVPIQPGALLKVTTRFYLREAPSGAYFGMQVQLLDDAGNVVAVRDTASGINSSPDKLLWCEEYVPIPAGAVRARPVLQFGGNPVQAEIVHLEFQSVANEDALPIFPLKIPFPHQALNTAELDAALEKRPRLHAAVAANGDQVEFQVNGETLPLKIYKNIHYTTLHDYPNFLKKTPAMQAAGFNVFTVGVYLGLPLSPRTANSVWLGEGKYQVEVMQQTVREILKYAPDAMIMLELMVSPPQGWASGHPDDIAQWRDGRKAVISGVRIDAYSDQEPEPFVPDPQKPWTMSVWIPSYFSEQFNRDTARALEDIFRAFEQTPEAKSVIGVFLARGVDGQWFDLLGSREATGEVAPLADYSPVSLRYFHRFLREKYHDDIEELRRSWQDSSVADFESIAIPEHEALFPADDKMVLRCAGKRDRVADFLESRAAGMAEQFSAFARAIKAGSGGRVLVGGYRPEGAITSWPFFTQQCSKWLYQVPEIDFFASCPGGRTPENPVMPWQLNGSLRLRHKLGITELDFRSPWTWNWGEWGKPLYYKTHDEREFRQRTMRAQLFAAALGGAFHAYDMDGNWYDTPMAIGAWSDNNRIYDRRRARPLTDDRMGMFFSERYWDYMALNYHRAFAHIVKLSPREAAVRSGADLDFYLLQDALHPELTAPKVLWFVDAVDLTPEEADAIRERHGNSGRVIVWMWAPGVGVTDDPGRVANFRLKRSPATDGMAVMAAEDVDDPLLKGVRGLLLADYKPYAMGPTWAVDDPEAKILGYYGTTRVPAMAVKRHGDYTEIFIGQAGNVTPALARNIARAAGVHCWLESDDAVASAGNLLIVSAVTTGEKTIRLPAGVRGVECLTGQPVRREGDSVKCDMQHDDVLVLEMAFE